MEISAVYAITKNGAFGDSKTKSGLPWLKQPREMELFHEYIKGKVVLVGPRTYALCEKWLRKYCLEVCVVRKEELVDIDSFHYHTRYVAEKYGQEVPIVIAGGHRTLLAIKNTFPLCSARITRIEGNIVGENVMYANELIPTEVTCPIHSKNLKCISTLTSPPDASNEFGIVIYEYERNGPVIFHCKECHNPVKISKYMYQALPDAEKLCINCY